MTSFSKLRRGERRANSSGRRSRRFVPSLPVTLESRQLLAAGPLGIDLASTLGYVDVMKESQAWQPLNSSTLAVDANGWPLADAQILVLNEQVNQSYNGPDPVAAQPDIGGTYHLSFQGQATVMSDGLQNFTVQNQVYDTKSNLTTADINVFHNSPAILLLYFRNTVNPASSTGAGVANVKLIQPGYAADTTQVFTNNIVNDVAPFSTLRYLNIDQANSYGPVYDNSYQTFSTPIFTVPAGLHSISFQGLNTKGDATAFVDNVSIVNDSSSTAGAPALADQGFETPSVGANNFASDPQGTPWTFNGGSGVSANDSAYTSFNSNAPEGQQVAFIQNQGAISQTLTNFAADSYHINFSAMQRNGYAPQTLEVLVDGKPVGTFNPPTGNLNTVDWSQRKLPTASSQIAGPGAPGQSWEYMIALANATNTDLWINIPGPATDNYVTQLANLIKNGDTINGVYYAGLNPNLKVNIEYSSEVWGGIFGPFAYNLEATQLKVFGGNTTLNNDGLTETYQLAQRNYLERTMEVTNIFRNVLGPDPTFSKIRPMLTSPEGNFSYFTTLFPWFEKTHGAPSQYFYGIGSANYAFPSDYSSVDNLINSLFANLPQQFATTASFATVANYYGLQNVAYEGGPNTGSIPNAAAGPIALAASRDARMESFLDQLYTTWYAAGGSLAVVFDGPYDVVGPFNQFATAEVAQAGNPTSSAKYRGLVDLSQANPTVVTAGYAVSPSGATPLSVSSDSLGKGFTSNTLGQTNYWLLNVASAGNYDLHLQPNPGTTNGQVSVSLSDSKTIGTYTLGASGTDYLTSVFLHAGLNTLDLTTLSPFGAASLSLNPTPVASVKDSGFEAVSLASNSPRYVYNPQGDPWTFAGTSGVTGNNTGFTSGNPNAPEGQQVAFLQNQGAISQVVNNWSAGNYVISFNIAQRANFGVTQTVQVLVDGTPIQTFRATSPSYQLLGTSAFAVSAGSHTITFQGLNTVGDGSAFIDAVTIAQAPAAPAVGDSGFEAVSSGVGNLGYVYNPQGDPWTFSGTSGVTGNHTGFTNGSPDAPEGQQVAFIQNQGAISQVVDNWSAGSYAIGFQLAQRANFGVSQTIQVLVDGVVVSTFTASSTSYQSAKTAKFKVGAGAHTILFKGLNTVGDGTDFIDNISITPQ